MPVRHVLNRHVLKRHVRNVGNNTVVFTHADTIGELYFSPKTGFTNQYRYPND